jgi:hypothetical protein
MPSLLEWELRTFEAKRLELLGRAVEKFVLIRGDQVLGIFESQTDALKRGYERFGNQPFLVKQVLEVDIPQNYQFAMSRS